MQLKCYLIFILIIYNHFAFGISINRKNMDTFLFLKKEEYFSFLKPRKNFFLTKKKSLLEMIVLLVLLKKIDLKYFILLS